MNNSQQPTLKNIRITRHAYARFTERFMNNITLNERRTALRMMQLLTRALPWGGQRGSNSHILLASMSDGNDIYFAVCRDPDGFWIIQTCLTEAMAIANMQKMRPGKPAQTPTQASAEEKTLQETRAQRKNRRTHNQQKRAHKRRQQQAKETRQFREYARVA